MVSKGDPRPLVQLIVPPYTPPMVPHLGVSTLAGYLREQGIDARQVDLNIRLHDELLNDPSMLAAIIEQLQDAFDGLDRHATLDRDQASVYLRLLRELCQAHTLAGAQSVIAAQCHIPYPDLEPLPFGYPTQQDAFRLVDVGLALLGVRRMVFGQPTGAALDQVTEAGAALLRSFFARHLGPDRIENPALFGISLLYESQVGCALLLAECLRKWYPGALLIAGGPLAARLDSAHDSLAQSFDAIVVGEGEAILAQLCHQQTFQGALRPWVLDAKAPLRRVPRPVFSREDLERYWGRPLTLPIQASRGCYWGSCAFCSYSTCYSGSYRCMPPGTVVAMIRSLQDEYGCSRYQLVDDCPSPGFLSRFADALGDLEEPVAWSTCVRFEPRFDLVLLRKLARAGCRRLTFGLETVSPRLLEYIHKGTSADTYLPILQACKEAGIEVHINWIAGLPSETPAELEETRHFLFEHADLYSYQFGHVFTLEPGSPFAIAPEHFGLPPGITQPFHAPAEKARLYEIIRSLVVSEEQKPPAAPLDDRRLRWSPQVARTVVNYDLADLQQLIASGEGLAHRLDKAEWCLYASSNDQIGQLSQEALAWIESQLECPLDDQARDVLQVFYERSFVEPVEPNA